MPPALRAAGLGAGRAGQGVARSGPGPGRDPGSGRGQPRHVHRGGSRAPQGEGPRHARDEGDPRPRANRRDWRRKLKHRSHVRKADPDRASGRPDSAHTGRLGTAAAEREALCGKRAPAQSPGGRAEINNPARPDDERGLRRDRAAPRPDGGPEETAAAPDRAGQAAHPGTRDLLPTPASGQGHAGITVRRPAGGARRAVPGQGQAGEQRERGPAPDPPEQARRTAAAEQHAGRADRHPEAPAGTVPDPLRAEAGADRRAPRPADERQPAARAGEPAEHAETAPPDPGRRRRGRVLHAPAVQGALGEVHSARPDEPAAAAPGAPAGRAARKQRARGRPAEAGALRGG